MSRIVLSTLCRLASPHMTCYTIVMNRTLLLLSAASLALLGCKKDEKQSDGLQPAKISQPANATGAQAPPHGAAHGAESDGKKGGVAEGKVAETMNAGGYTYVKLEGASGDVWAAAPETVVKVGDSVAYTGGISMPEFRSNTLDRTFALVYLVSAFTINGAAAAKTPSALGAKTNPGPSAADVDLTGIAKAEGGMTVAEVFAGQDGLAGKEVTLRGKVVKYNGGIMGSNWIHLRDGSGAEGTNDLTITTNATSQVGATIVVKGKVTLNKDFGAGYKYAIIIENASITVE